MVDLKKKQNELSVRWIQGALGLVLAAGCVSAARADQFMKPTAEELSMTSVPGHPGVPAVVLYREEIDKDDIHSVTHYERVKILTEEGKKYANVELRFVSVFDDNVGAGDSKNVESIVGRTIHSDGTIIPFTGKPYLKVVEKAGGIKLQERVFTLPDVQVGSIIEYRYAERSENFYEAPRWYIQGELPVKSAHYTWYPTRFELHDGDGKAITAISWFPILPEGVKIERHETPASSVDGGSGPQQTYDVVVKDVPPVLHEDHMPPLESYSYRVLFNFTPYRTQQEYWNTVGKDWSKRADQFMNGGGSLRDATAKIIDGAATPAEKVAKIYAAVMALENTDFSREHERREDHAAGLGKVSNVNDVLSHKRGTPSQLTELFIAMVRTTGVKAYLGAVPDREERLFSPMWMNFNQLDEPIAIVNLDGKDRYFDPGERYCAFGHLAWQHTFVAGLRQTDNGVDFIGLTPGATQTYNRSTRVANLKLDAQGQVSGKIDMTFSGAAALRWRQSALRGDEESIRHSLRTTLEEMVPKSMEVKVSSIDGLTDYDKPLAVHYEASGTLGTPTGKRVMLPLDLFQSSASATFPHDKRELPVYFHYPQTVQDAIKINFDPSLAIEAAPEGSKATILNEAGYVMAVQQGPTFFVARRDYVFGDVLVPQKDYDQLRKFYSEFESKDQESVVLKTAPATATASASSSGSGK